MNAKVRENTRNVAIVGPYSGGKTTLLESLLFVTKAITRKGTIKDRNTVSDCSPEAKERQMSVEVSAASTTYQDIELTFLDCPGSIEFAQETYNALVGAGAAIIVCEPVIDRILTLAPLFKFLDDWEIPHLVFINKMDRFKDSFMDVLHALKNISSRPLIPQQYPIRQDRELVGYIDLVTEQAYHYHVGNLADPVPIPDHLKEEEHLARQEMLEVLADFDDHLLEELLEDIAPPQEEILNDLKQDLSEDLIVPVFFGIAEQDYGVRPLLDVLLKEAPAPTVTAQRRGLTLEAKGETLVQVLKTYFTQQGGQLSLVRVWQGELTDGMALNGSRAGGIYRLMGQTQQSIGRASVGQIVAIGRLEGVHTGDTLSSQGQPSQTLPRADVLEPVYALAINPENRQDEVKLSNALAKLVEEDPSLYWEQHGDTKEVILWGQGEIQLMVALDRLRRKYNLPMTTQLPQVPYKETIRQETNVHGRYKHQTGGHGAFGDVYLNIKPLARGEGFHFHQTIVGGVVPKQYIPGVETGVREYLAQGPLGFPVVDIDVTLTDGSYHAVDSSEQAFKQAARIAMTEGMVKCHPILLEPILSVTVFTPCECTSKVLQLVSGRRGQILGYESMIDSKAWDQVKAYLPQAEMHNFIIELRSLTMGVGTFTWKYAHLQEVPEKRK
ncbi:elongation factor G [Aphanothece sacrum]|uniref:Translation elongation factor-like GTPase n=1 Tax=Aphanothece sacrum FPU1 TaxID=1920663 RepID=A0A401ID04_APHSA|nr:elongation factor G [Aphanothece sacrum]GBF79168.1 translation elongation factor-like GTPase [Aphanothece sacrum FPU1]GBF86557.1 translation elongation factor GTPase [Aphanothece sacrum FPU3]